MSAVSSPKELALSTNRIRVETAFSRFPIHCLSRKKTHAIDLQRLNDAGVADFKWEVTYNSKHGQPGPLAYKVDTLVINRLLDQLGRPLPEFVRIGSLSEVCRLLGTQDTGPNIANVKSAFLQNASAFINAKMRYKTRTGREKWTEVAYTRYSVIFTGEKLPDGRQADAVHIVLNPPYRELLNHVETRPLDYDYLKRLPPGPQRFYELLSFQIYGAIAGGRPRAKLLYSDYCKYAPQVRYLDFNHVKKQMYKLHLPHRESGYIEKIDYRAVVDRDEQPDWEMFYTPGPKAFAEYQAFTNRQAHATSLLPQSPNPPSERFEGPTQGTLEFRDADSKLLMELTRRGITEKKAHELLADMKPGQEIIDQLEYVDFLIAKDTRRKLENPPGLFVYYIRDNVTVPPEFNSSRKARLQQEAEQARNAEIARRTSLETEYDQYCDVQVDLCIKAMSPESYQTFFEEQRKISKTRFKSMSPEQRDHVAHRLVRAELANGNHIAGLLSFDDFTKNR